MQGTQYRDDLPRKSGYPARLLSGDANREKGEKGENQCEGM